LRGVELSARDVPLFDVLERVGLGVWDWNLATAEVFASPRLKALLGYGPGDPFDPNLDAQTHPEDLASLRQARQDHWEGRTPYYKHEHRVRHRAGHWMWVLSRGLVVERDAQGRPVRMAGFQVDVTARKQDDLQHVLTHERLELALHGTNDGLWDWNLQTDERYWSPRFMSLLHYSDAQEFNRVFSLRGHLHPEDVERVIGLMWAHLDGRSELFDAECRFRCREGAYRWVHARGKAMRNGTGKPVRFAGHITDITDRVAADAAREALQVQLREAHKQEALGDLASGVAREFNLQLDVALAQIGELQPLLDQSDAQVSGRTAAVRQALVRSQALARQIQAFSRRQAKHLAVIDLSAVVGCGLDALAAVCPPHVTLKRQLAQPGPMVLADVAQFGSLLDELWRNAVQAFVVAGGTVEVVVAHDAARQGAWFTVKDDGQGMPPEVLARAFEPFFSTGRPGAGVGLGLAAVQAIVKGHQGQVSLRSTPGLGTQVDIWLPAVAQADTAPPPRPEVASPVAEGDGRQRHVVFIDDYEAMVYLITRMLRKRGCRVSAFERAADALALVQANPADVDLLVTDYNMPGMSGLDVVRQVKAWRADLPVVITSGHVTPAMKAEAFAEGVSQVLGKHDSVEAMADQLVAVLAQLPPRSDPV
jgi:PAS domain S-box-containing protein